MARRGGEEERRRGELCRGGQENREDKKDKDVLPGVVWPAVAKAWPEAWLLLQEQQQEKEPVLEQEEPAADC